MRGLGFTFITKDYKVKARKVLLFCLFHIQNLIRIELLSLSDYSDISVFIHMSVYTDCNYLAELFLVSLRVEGHFLLEFTCSSVQFNSIYLPTKFYIIVLVITAFSFAEKSLQEQESQQHHSVLETRH